MGDPQYIKDSERDKYSDPNVWKIADSFVDTGDYIRRVLDAGLAKWNITNIFMHLKNEVRVSKEHPFDLLIRKKTDIFPSITVHWTNDTAAMDLLGHGMKTEQVTSSYIDIVKGKDLWNKLTSDIVLDEAKSFIDAQSGNKVYANEEKFYFNETIEIAIWDNNLDVRTLLYKITKAIILSELSNLYSKGSKVISMSGVPEGLFNDEFGIGMLYGAEIRLEFRNLMWIERVNKGTPLNPAEIKEVIHGAADIGKIR